MSSILVVDDDIALSGLIQALLQRAGHEVQAAQGGVEATRRLGSGSFDLLITDILMPERDGIELIRLVRASRPELKIIAISGGGNVGSDLIFRFARGLGVVSFLRKPFQVEELLTMVKSVLGGA